MYYTPTTDCSILWPTAVQTCLCVSRLAILFCIGSTYGAKYMEVCERLNQSYGDGFRSRMAANANPASAPAGLVKRSAG